MTLDAPLTGAIPASRVSGVAAELTTLLRDTRARGSQPALGPREPPERRRRTAGPDDPGR